MFAWGSAALGGLIFPLPADRPFWHFMVTYGTPYSLAQTAVVVVGGRRGAGRRGPCASACCSPSPRCSRSSSSSSGGGGSHDDPAVRPEAQLPQPLQHPPALRASRGRRLRARGAGLDAAPGHSTSTDRSSCSRPSSWCARSWRTAERRAHAHRGRAGELLPLPLGDPPGVRPAARAAERPGRRTGGRAVRRKPRVAPPAVRRVRLLLPHVDRLLARGLLAVRATGDRLRPPSRPSSPCSRCSAGSTRPSR